MNPTMENQLEQKMGNEMDTGIIMGYIGVYGHSGKEHASGYTD